MACSSLVCVIFTLGLNTGYCDRDSVMRLRRILFANYSVTQRPVIDRNKAVEVGAKMWVFHVEDVNDTQQTIKFHGVMQMSWRDEFLTWKPANYDGLKYIMTHNLAVWTPKLTLLNSAETRNLNYFWNLPVKVWSTGYVYATVELSITSTCAFDLTNFPHDVQRCPVAFYLGATMDQVVFTIILDPELRFYWRQGNKDSEGNKKTASNWVVVGSPEVYRKYYTASGLNDTIGLTPPHAATMIMEIWLTFARRLSYFPFTIVLPAVLTSIITVAAMMPMQTLYSLGILMLNLLAQATYIDDVFIMVPTSIGTVPRIVKYYGMNMIMTVLAIFARLLIQASLNAVQEDQAVESEQHEQGILLSRKSRMHSFFTIHATPSRLYLLFITSYALIYTVCAASLL